MRFLGVDTGGTFTDFAYFDGETLKIHKVLSTPVSPDRAILQGIQELGIDTGSLYIIHGSTVGTNALLENKGVKTAYITNRGLADVLSIGRQARSNIYDLAPKGSPIPVEPELCFELDTRLAATGELLRGIDPRALQQLLDHLATLDIEAVAVNLLFSFLDSSQEHLIAQALPKNLFVSCSADVLAESGEYERGIATWINASLGPLIQRYLQQLANALPESSLAVMHSSGGTSSAAEASRMAVHLLLSGPAGGLMAANTLADITSTVQALTFDMGGTSTDVSLLDGEFQLTGEGVIGRYPVSVPMVDMHTIGAGGGSIAYVDEGGLLQVGPESAGAKPGPACYALGGRQATVTDANVVLGRLPLVSVLGGSMALDKQAAIQAVQDLAQQMGVNINDAACGIISLANEHMVQALRVISVQRGVDVRNFSLLCFGGAGGLHVCALAGLMGIQKAIVPIHSGVLSAIGMLLAPRQRVASQAINKPIESKNDTELNQLFKLLDEKIRGAILAEGVLQPDIRAQYSLDLRYVGQSYFLEIPWNKKNTLATQEFHGRHKQRYGHSMDLPIELVNVRAKLQGPPPSVSIPVLSNMGNQSKSAAAQYTKVHGYSDQVACWQRDQLIQEQTINGPAIVLESISTTFIDHGWVATVDSYGNLLLQCRSE